MEILVGYGVGPNMLRLIKHFWDTALLVCRAAGYYGGPFQAFRGVTQGGPLSPRIFNMMVDAVVREWLRRLLGEEAARHGYGAAVRELMAIFYADDAILASRDPVALQRALDVIVELFERVGLRTNTSKTKVMTCVPGKIRTRLSQDAYNNSREGMHANDDWKKLRVTCDLCDMDLAAGSLPSHLEAKHDVFRSKVINQDLLVERDAKVYHAMASYDGTFYCPVPGCLGKATTKWTLRRHFGQRHPLDLVSVPGQGCYPRCEGCAHQVSPLATRHRESKNCREGTERRVQHEAAANSARALQQQFTAYGEPLERVEVFKYLGRLMAYDDNDAQAINTQLKKARKSWARISRVLRAENASPRVCGMFYKATVQAVLLFGSETWNTTPAMMKRLDGFHMRAAWRMARINKPRRNLDGSWTYPSSELTLEEVALHPIAYYVEVRRQTIAKFIVNRPIFEYCREGKRKRGSSPRQSFLSTWN